MSPSLAAGAAAAAAAARFFGADRVAGLKYLRAPAAVAAAAAAAPPPGDGCQDPEYPDRNKEAFFFFTKLKCHSIFYSFISLDVLAKWAWLRFSGAPPHVLCI